MENPTYLMKALPSQPELPQHQTPHLTEEKAPKLSGHRARGVVVHRSSRYETVQSFEEHSEGGGDKRGVGRKVVAPWDFCGGPE